MIRYECDRCGARMGANDPRRFIVKLEVYAAAGHMDLTAELEGDVPGAFTDVVQALAAADPDDIEDQTYRSFRFDVCDACRKAVLFRPLATDPPDRSPDPREHRADRPPRVL